MKKYMILLIFLEFVLINSSDQYSFIFKSKCEDTKSKAGACSYDIYDSKGNLEHAIFNKCGKGKRCDDEVCVENLKYRKYGESCNYDNDCLTNYCKNNKCDVAKENEKCNYDIFCGSGLYCFYGLTNEGKCAKLAKEGTKPDNNVKCMAGFGVDKDDKCTKYGTLEDGDEIGGGDKLLCKSGLSHYNTDKKKIVCDSIKTDPQCKNGIVTKKGEWIDGTPIDQDGYCKLETDYKGTEIEFYGISKLQSKFYGEFLEDYKDLNLDQINSEDKYASYSNYNLIDTNKIKWKTYEKYRLYQYAPGLQAAGILDSEGNVVDDKKCEYDFLIKSLNSGFIKLKTILIALIFLLF